LGNENLDAQYVHTVEAQILYSPWKFFDARTGIAYSFIQDKTNFVKEQINLVAYNIIDIGGISWESEIAAHYKDWVRGYANLSFQHLFFDESDKHQGYAQQLYGLNMNVTPPWVINAGVLGQIPHTPLKLSVNASYVSSRRASATNILENGKIYELDPYVMLDAYVALVDQKFIPDKETFVRVYFRNLLGVEGPDPGLSGFDYPLAPRTIMLQWIQEL
jgi:iron complex outermembrane receptor protein